MLQKPASNDALAIARTRIVSLDRARTFITLLVVLHHSVVNYTHFGNGDKARWLGFDLVVLFNDSFFMACMFLISGLFVRESLARRGPANFIANRAWRLGVPYLVSIFVLMPLAYYPTFLRYHMPGTTDFNFFHFWWRVFTVGPWPSGPAWFIWVLLASIRRGALVGGQRRARSKGLGGRSIGCATGRALPLFAFLVFSVIVYVPMRLWVGDAAWFEPDGFPCRSRPAASFSIRAISWPVSASVRWIFAWVSSRRMVNSRRAGRHGSRSRSSSMARSCSSSMPTIIGWRTSIRRRCPGASAYGLAFALFSGAMAFAEPALFLRFAKTPLRLLDAMRPSAYGIFLTHYIFIIWLQYAVYDPDWSPFVKFAIVFLGTLAGSWATVILLRRIPAVGSMI